MEKMYDGIYQNVFVFDSHDKKVMENFSYTLYKRNIVEYDRKTIAVLTSKYKKLIIEGLGNCDNDTYLTDICHKFVSHGYRLELNQETGKLEWVIKALAKKTKPPKNIVYFLRIIGSMIVALPPIILAASSLIIDIQSLQSIHDLATKVGAWSFVLCCLELMFKTANKLSK